MAQGESELAMTKAKCFCGWYGKLELWSQCPRCGALVSLPDVPATMGSMAATLKDIAGLPEVKDAQ